MNNCYLEAVFFKPLRLTTANEHTIQNGFIAHQNMIQTELNFIPFSFQFTWFQSIPDPVCQCQSNGARFCLVLQKLRWLRWEPTHCQSDDESWGYDVNHYDRRTSWVYRFHCCCSCCCHCFFVRASFRRQKFKVKSNRLIGESGSTTRYIPTQMPIQCRASKQL